MPGEGRRFSKDGFTQAVVELIRRFGFAFETMWGTAKRQAQKWEIGQFDYATSYHTMVAQARAAKSRCGALAVFSDAVGRCRRGQSRGKEGPVHDDASSREPRQALSGVSDDKMMLAFIGFGFYLAFQSCTSFSPGLSLMQGFSVDQAAALRVATMVVQIASLSLAFSQARKILVDPLKILTRGTMFIGVYFACAISLFFVGPVFSLALVAWAFLGLSLSSLALFWCIILSSSSMRGGVTLFVKAAVLNIVLFLVVALLNPPVVSVLGYVALAVASVVSARLLYRQAPVRKDVEPFELPVNGRAVVNSYAVPFAVCNGFVVGFFVFATCEQGLFTTAVAMASGILGVALSFALYRVFPKSAYNVRYLHQSALPILVAAVLAMPFFEAAGLVVGACITIVVRAYAQVSSWYEIASTIREFGLNPIQFFSRRNIPMWAGFLLGTVASCLVIDMDLFARPGLGFILAAVLTFFLVSSYALYELREMMIVDRMDGVIAENACKEGSIGSMFEASFAAKCEKIIEAYGLSPREAEVFRLLAKGRNAEYIQNELFISISTVRTHIYHIYKKLEINSRQSLIDVVENSEDEAG